MTGRSVEPPRREGQGLVLLMAQTVLCVAALAVVFTMQYVKPREYKILGEYYTEITREDGDKQDEAFGNTNYRAATAAVVGRLAAAQAGGGICLGGWPNRHGRGGANLSAERFLPKGSSVGTGGFAIACGCSDHL